MDSRRSYILDRRLKILLSTHPARSTLPTYLVAVFAACIRGIQVSRYLSGGILVSRNPPITPVLRNDHPRSRCGPLAPRRRAKRREAPGPICSAWLQAQARPSTYEASALRNYWRRGGHLVDAVAITPLRHFIRISVIERVSSVLFSCLQK